jgi:hypothetical protein
MLQPLRSRRHVPWNMNGVISQRIELTLWRLYDNLWMPSSLTSDGRQRTGVFASVFTQLYPLCRIWGSHKSGYEDLRLLQRWLWRMSSSGMWRCVDLVLTDVSEERIATIFRVEKSASEEPAWAGGHPNVTLPYGKCKSNISGSIYHQIICSFTEQENRTHNSRYLKEYNAYANRSMVRAREKLQKLDVLIFTS